MKRRHDYVLRVIHTCYCYGSFSYVVKLRNLTKFILELMTELILLVSENSRLSIQISFVAVFVKIVNQNVNYQKFTEC